MELEICSRRWGHNDTYIVNKTSTGWWIHHITRGGDCDKRGHPHLFEIFDNDGVNYPESFGGYMEWLWEQSEERNMSDDEIQENLAILGRWIQQVEKSSPRGLWQNYK